MGTLKESAPLCNLSFLVLKMERGSLRGKHGHLYMCEHACGRACARAHACLMCPPQQLGGGEWES